MKRRWFFYLLIGILFGIFDFFFQTWIYQIFPVGSRSTAMQIPIWGVWLLVVVPVALNEVKTSRSVWLTAASSVFTWSVAVVAYYLFMGVKLIFIGQASRAEMHISNHNAPYYWSNIKSFFVGDFLSGVGEWIIVALVGGCLVGLAVGFLALRVMKPVDRKPQA